MKEFLKIDKPMFEVGPNGHRIVRETNITSIHRDSEAVLKDKVSQYDHDLSHLMGYMLYKEAQRLGHPSVQDLFHNINLSLNNCGSFDVIGEILPQTLDHIFSYATPQTVNDGLLISIQPKAFPEPDSIEFNEHLSKCIQTDVLFTLDFEILLSAITTELDHIEELSGRPWAEVNLLSKPLKEGRLLQYLGWPTTRENFSSTMFHEDVMKFFDDGTASPMLAHIEVHLREVAMNLNTYRIVYSDAMKIAKDILLADPEVTYHTQNNGGAIIECGNQKVSFVEHLFRVRQAAFAVFNRASDKDFLSQGFSYISSENPRSMVVDTIKSQKILSEIKEIFSKVDELINGRNCNQGEKFHTSQINALFSRLEVLIIRMRLFYGLSQLPEK